MENRNTEKTETEQEYREDYNNITTESFEDIGLKNALLRGIYSYGFDDNVLC